MITFKELGKFGRLSNQLFQIAATIGAALDNETEYLFPVWEYEKDFNLHNCFSSNLPTLETYNEPFFHYSKIPNNKNLNLKGFFQSLYYFNNHSNLILGLLTPKITYKIKWGATSLHIRRGDYVNNSAYYQLFMDNYYSLAMNKINSEYYMVFSDDIEWCKQKFIGSQFIFIEGNSPITDMSLMSSCENNIISNSSFSWWGAFLNKNPSKTIIAPNKWFGEALSYHNTKDLIPTNWIKL